MNSKNLTKKERDRELAHRGMRVGRTSAGCGIYATKKLRKDQFLLEYTGEEISHEEADRRGGRYLFTLNEKIVVDGKGYENVARYFNHSCEPNVEAIIEDDIRIVFHAMRNIDIDEELTFDYGEEYVRDIISKEGCLCKKCTA